MILLEVPENRKRRHDFWLGGTTAAVAGLVNVCSVMAFFAFASNVTGHVAIFAEEMVKGHWHQLNVVIVWLLAFLGGAFVANFLVTSIGSSAVRLGRAFPLKLEIALLAAVGYYGQYHYAETLKETEYLVGTLLFAMGLQNGLVATVSKGVVKTTHLTGLATDLGMELSLILQRRSRRDEDLRFKLRLHLIVLFAYVAGGILGGVLFLRFGFAAFYVACVVLASLLVHDVVARRASQASEAEVLATAHTGGGAEPLAARSAEADESPKSAVSAAIRATNGTSPASPTNGKTSAARVKRRGREARA